MMENLNNWSLIITIIVSVVTVLTALISVSVKIGSTLKTINDLKEDFKSFGSKLSSFQEKLMKTDYKTDNNRTSIKKIYKKIADIESVVNNFSAKNFPRQLNDLGLEHYKKMRGEEFLKANKDYLFNFIDNEKPISAWDVEKDSLIALESMIDMIEFKPIKDYLYIAPERVLPNGLKTELNEYSACQILYLPLRDMYLEAHPELQPKEIFA